MSVPQRFQGVSRETWAEVLDAAAGAGLLTGLGGGMYRIHPALPAYLAARWRTEDRAGYDGQRAAATRALLLAYAALGGWLLRQIGSGDAGLAYTVIGLQQRTMGHLLGYALDGQLWDEAQAIAQPLTRYWDSRGLSAEAAAWTDRVRLATEDADGPPRTGQRRRGPVALFRRRASRRQANSGRLDAAERTYREILAMLQAQPTSPQQQRILRWPTTSSARSRRGGGGWMRPRTGTPGPWPSRRNSATGPGWRTATTSSAWSRTCGGGWMRPRTGTRSLAINEQLGDRHGMAITYHQLGMVAQEPGAAG